MHPIFFGEALMKNSLDENKMPILNLQQVNARSNHQREITGIIENLSLNIERGEIYGLLCESYPNLHLLEKLISGFPLGKDLTLSSGKIEVNGYSPYFNPENSRENKKNSPKAKVPQKVGFEKYNDRINRVSVIHKDHTQDVKDKGTVMDQITQRMLEEKIADLSDSIVLRNNMNQETLLTFMREIQVLWGRKRDITIEEFAAEHGLKGFTWIIKQYAGNFYDPEISTSWMLEKMNREYDGKTIDRLTRLSSYKKSGETLEKIISSLKSTDETLDDDAFTEKEKEIKLKQKEVDSEYKNFEFLLKFMGRSMANELKNEAKMWTENYLNELGFEDSDTLLDKKLHDLSPGEAKLISYVMNVICDPDLVIIEQTINSLGPMSNASVRRDIKRRAEENGTSFLIFAESLSDIRDICSRVGIMYSGRIVEEGKTTDIIADPKHPLTISMNAVEEMVSTGKRDESYRNYIQEGMPEPGSLPAGCYFQPRCKFSLDTCSTRKPILLSNAGHKVACFLYSNEFEVPT